MAEPADTKAPSNGLASSFPSVFLIIDGGENKTDASPANDLL